MGHLEHAIGLALFHTSRSGLAMHMEEVVNRGGQAIILGCTELPMLVSACDVSVPLFDTTAILAKAALDVAVGDSK